MSTFKAQCPYCGTRDVMFIVEYTGENVSIIPPGKCDVFAKCYHCNRKIVATYSCSGSGFISRNTFYSKFRGQTPETIAPSLPDSGAPPHTPERAAEFYRQGMENLPGNPDAAGTMFRKALETALRERFPNHGEMNLLKRIKTATEAGDLTPALAEWAHKIRFDGNSAAHESITPDQARDMQLFTELVLRYLFELPGMLEEARGKRGLGPLN